MRTRMASVTACPLGMVRVNVEVPVMRVNERFPDLRLGTSTRQYRGFAPRVIAVIVADWLFDADLVFGAVVCSFAAAGACGAVADWAGIAVQLVRMSAPLITPRAARLPLPITRVG